MYRHILFLEFKKNAEAARQRYLEGLRRLEEIPGVLSVEHGPNVNVNSTAEYVVIINLENEATLKTYRPHPIHEHLVKNIVPEAIATIMRGDLIV